MEQMDVLNRGNGLTVKQHSWLNRNQQVCFYRQLFHLMYICSNPQTTKKTDTDRRDNLKKLCFKKLRCLLHIFSLSQNSTRNVMVRSSGTARSHSSSCEA